MAVETLTAWERELLPLESRIKYDTAISLCTEECAHGPFGGWADGHKLLKEIGWQEVVRDEGHRSFITLTKPCLAQPASGGGE